MRRRTCQTENAQTARRVRVAGSSARHVNRERAGEAVGRHLDLLQADGVKIDLLGQGIVVASLSVHPNTWQLYSWMSLIIDPATVPPLSP